MIKTAIFVEGQTELIFTRELLLKHFEWQDVCIECYSLFNDENKIRVEYSYRDPNGTFFFEILNIGNDRKVLSSILKREQFLLSQGFNKIIGLRDMYSKDYREIVKDANVNNEVCQRFIDSHQKTIKDKAKSPDIIRFNFAIMELESWLLGIDNLFVRLHTPLDNSRILTECEIDLLNSNPEQTVFHPAQLLNKILKIVGDGYDKKKGEVNKFMAHIEKQDILNLLQGSKCSSFNKYCESLAIYPP